MFVIVPDYVHDAIKAALDKAIKAVPDAQKDYQSLYSALLAHYNEHGEIPDFAIQKKDQQ